jgi:GNAT superfamily N-acetyltransferase
MGRTLELTTAEQVGELAGDCRSAGRVDAGANRGPVALDSAGSGVVGCLSPRQFTADGADAHLVRLNDGCCVTARCSIWAHGTPLLDGVRVGVIGHYAAADADAGKALLLDCCERLAASGCPLAVGPMDGSTWRSYRFITRRGDEPTFLFEPDHPDDWPDHFAAAGFRTLARYVSTVNDDLARRDDRLGRIEARMNRDGVRVRPIVAGDMRAELSCIHEVCLTAFADAFLYTPIARQAFLDLYERVVPFVEPRLVLVAEHAGRTVGFIFALPDLNQARRGDVIDTLVVKTLATLPGVVPDRRYAGLGTLLLDRCQQAGRELGCRRAIHALMRADNQRVQALTGKYARPFREYALFARETRP